MKTNPIIKAFWKRTERLDKKRYVVYNYVVNVSAR